MKGKHHRFNNDNIAHDHNQDHIMRERDNHIATSTSPQPRGGTTPASSWEAATSMKMDPEAPTPSDMMRSRVCTPLKLGFDDGRVLMSF